MADTIAPSAHAGSELAFALVESSQAAALLLDDGLAVVAVSTSFLRAFQLALANVVGRKIADLGDGEWSAPQLGSLLRATASGAASIDAYELEMARPGGGSSSLVLHAQKLDYGVADAPLRLLLTVTDVTKARGIERLKDELLRDKAVALQEVQHRVANSLQIIASVILQSARKAQSEESRGQLRDAHNRVMSVAALQQQLATSQIGDVALKPYFIQLCDSIGASMIQDHDQIKLNVEVDNSLVDANTSISLGLLVTELVINCLKHAFPDGRKGRILVRYTHLEPGWSLEVLDDGVGMQNHATEAQAGLGTSIVQALARQLKSTVDVLESDPGTRVTITNASSTAMPTVEPV
jgi:two-component sensor histidine kinase